MRTFAPGGYEYDLAGNVKTVLGEDGYREHYEYNGVGQVTLFTDALGRQTGYHYDDVARLDQLLLPDPDGPTGVTNAATTFVYDAASQLKSVTDHSTSAVSRTTNYEYTARGWLKQVKLPAATSGGTRPETDYEYDKIGNLKKVKELVSNSGSPVFRETNYTYDYLNRLDKVTLPAVQNGTNSGTTNPVWTYKYDEFGRLKNVWDPVATSTTNAVYSTEYAYNNLSQLESVTLPEPAPSAARPKTDYEYTLTGQVQTMVELVTTGSPNITRTTTYQYDELDRLIRSISPDASDGTGPNGGDPNTATPDATDQPFMTYVYDAAGNLTSQTDALSHATDYEYDRLYRLTKQTRVDQDGNHDAVTSFGYDLVGNRTSLTDSQTGHNNTTIWTYDNLDRVLDETNTLGAPRSYQYDLAGNLTTTIDRLQRVTTYDYDNLDRQTAEKWYGSDNTLTKTIASNYDLLDRLQGVTDRDGSNVAASADYSYLYDVGDRMTQVTSTQAGLSGTVGDVLFNQKFDLANRLVQQKVDTTGPTTVHDYVNDLTRDKLGRVTKITQQAQGIGGMNNPVAAKRVDFTYNLTS